MYKSLLRLGLGLTFTLLMVPKGFAVQPAPINQDASVSWSSVINDPFDGRVVYDKNFGDGFAFVSSWSMQGIRATYTTYWSTVVGYRTVWRTRTVSDGHNKRREVNYPVQEPIYESRSRKESPQAILFAISGQVYTYEGGSVTPELATALSNAPRGNMRIRLRWADGRTTDLEIGAGTVESWKSIFRVTAAASEPAISEPKK
ncbi:MAG: hypothetical protein SFW36_03545 [Leptolyngbyaceae cyanobacterium bins.59]|nr:hypothetical protein [Leptolyngbyaceae cyanobacterium bins.59]